MAMVMCRKCGRMTLVPFDAKPTDVARCTHCGNEIQKPALKENAMPDMLFDPEQQSLADEGAFAPPGAAPQPKAAGMPGEKKKPAAEMPSAKAKPVADESWETAPIGAQPTATTSGARGTTQGSRSTKAGRRKRNPAVELVKMAVGGILGLAIGYGILLYGFRVDPFNMARYLPDAMVPESVKTP